MKKIQIGNKITYLVGDDVFYNLYDALLEKAKHINPKWKMFLHMAKIYPNKYRVTVKYVGETLGTQFALNEIQNNNFIDKILGLKPWNKQIDYFYSEGKYE